MSRSLTVEHKAKISKSTKKRWENLEARARQSEKTKKQWEDPEYRAKISEAWIGENNPMKKPEVRAKRSGENHHAYGKHLSTEHRSKISAAQRGKTHSIETRAKMSASQKGEKSHHWRGGVSFEPYCHLFNEEKKEEVRNRDERKCQLCSKPEILNGERLDVHHIDGEKMQGCNDKKWALVALCHSCNSKADTLEKEFLIVSNLEHVFQGDKNNG